MVRVKAFGACPIFKNVEGCELERTVLIGTPGTWGITAGTGMELKDNDNCGFGVFAEVPSTGAVLTAGQVVKGAWFDLYLGKAQTGDVSLCAVQAHFECNAAYISGGSGLWAVFENGSEVALTTGNANGQAISCVVDVGASFSATRLSGIRISSSANASATITNFAAITVDGTFAGSAKKQFDYILDVQNEGAGVPGPAVAFARFESVAGVVDTTTTVTTQAGVIKVTVGTVSGYIPLYDMA